MKYINLLSALTLITCISAHASFITCDVNTGICRDEKGNIIPKQKPKLHALIIGVEDYKDKDISLKYIKDDASLMSRIFSPANTEKLYAQGKLTQLTTAKETTKINLIKHLKHMESIVKEDDLFVFYLNGFAQYVKSDSDLMGGYFFSASDTNVKNLAELRRQSITDSELQNLLKNIKSNKKLLVFDNCGSTALLNPQNLVTDIDAVIGRYSSNSIKPHSMEKQSGLTAFATGSACVSLSSFKHSLLTYTIAEGLKGGADSNHDSMVTSQELASYVIKKVPATFGKGGFPSVLQMGADFGLTIVNKKGK